MIMPSNHMTWPRPLIVLLIFSHLIGCAKWAVIEKPEDRYILENEPKWVEIELYTGEKIIMMNTQFKGDSLQGTREQLKVTPEGSVYFQYKYSVQLNEIKQIREKQTKIRATIGWTLFWTSIIVIILGILILEDEYGW